MNTAPVKLSRSKLPENPPRTDYRYHSFKDTNGLKGEFKNYDFSYSEFNRAYFRNAKFTGCKFIGCRFVECNFKGATFYSCEFDYAQFSKSQLEVEDVVANLPLEPNIRRDCLQNLRANCTEIGDYRSQRLLVLEEIEAEKRHEWLALTGGTAYYKTKYASALSKITAGIRLGWLNFGGFVWGNGERPWNIVFSATVLLLLLTLINFWSVLQRLSWTEAEYGIQILKYTANLFFDVPQDQKFRGFLVVDYAICAMRYLYVGLYISVLYRTISRR